MTLAESDENEAHGAEPEGSSAAELTKRMESLKNTPPLDPKYFKTMIPTATLGGVRG